MITKNCRYRVEVWDSPNESAKLVSTYMIEAADDLEAWNRGAGICDADNGKDFNLISIDGGFRFIGSLDECNEA